jgi:hypothetical protein
MVNDRIEEISGKRSLVSIEEIEDVRRQNVRDYLANPLDQDLVRYLLIP